MRIPRSLTLGLGASTAVAMLAACSGTGQQNSPLPSQGQTLQSVSRATTHTAVSAASIGVAARQPAAALVIGGGLRDAGPAGGLYVGQFAAATVNEYTIPDKNNSAPRCTVPASSVNGLGVNGNRVLYVPNGGSRSINAYKPNCGAAGRVLADPNGQPSDVAFNNKTGTVYVADNSTNCVDVYAKGATNPSSTLCNAATAGGFGVAVDSKGNVYQSGASSANIVKYPKGQQTGSKVLAATGLATPVGLEFDAKDNLIVIDITNGILVYAPPYKGAPSKTIAPQGSSVYGKLDQANKNLYVGDVTNGSADVYKYPSGTYKYSITNGLSQGNTVEGIAVDPPSPN